MSLSLRRLMIYQQSVWVLIDTPTTDDSYFIYDAANNPRGVYVNRAGQHYISVKGEWTPITTLEAGQLAVMMLA
jgi:hypothetical protein